MKLFLFSSLAFVLFSCSMESPASRWADDPVERAVFEVASEHVKEQVYPGMVREWDRHHISFNPLDSIYMVKLSGTYYDEGVRPFLLQMKTTCRQGKWTHQVQQFHQ